MSALRARARRASDRYHELAEERPLLGLPLEFLSRYTARQGLLLASATAFRLFLWLLPFSLMVAGVLAKVSSSDAGTAKSAVRSAGVTGAAGQQIVATLRTGNGSWWAAVAVGAVGTLLASRAMTRSLALVSAHLWQVPPPAQRARYDIGTTLLFLLTISTILGVSVLTPHLDGVVAGGVVIALLLETLSSGGAWLLMSLRLPDARRHASDLLPGAALFGASFTIIHTAGRIYLPRKIEHASQLYGGLAVTVVAAGWLLVIAQIVVASPLLNAVVLEYRSRVHHRSTESPAMDDGPPPAEGCAESRTNRTHLSQWRQP